MTMTAAEMIAVIQAFEDGKAIEFADSDATNWSSSLRPGWNFYNNDYRIAPAKKVKKYLWVCKSLHGGGGHYLNSNYYAEGSVPKTTEHTGIQRIESSMIEVEE